MIRVSSVVVLSFWSVVLCLAKVDFCVDNQIPAAPEIPKMFFTKELSLWEFGVESEFKSLHCCAKGYRSIEWLKDGKEYPWLEEVSGFILYPESANQTIYTPTLRPQDAGNYTCRVRNESMDIVHHIQLHIFDRTEYMERPLATYRPPPVSMAKLDSTTRLFCEAFIGHTDLPDAKNEVKWTKKDNSTWRTSKVHLQKVQRDFGRIIGSYLILEKVDWDDFGVYTCTISNSANQKIAFTTHLQHMEDPMDPLRLEVCTLVFVYIVVLFVTSTFIIFSIRSFLKNSQTISMVFDKITQISFMRMVGKNKSKEIGVFVCPNDKEFAETVLFPALKFRNLQPIIRIVYSEGSLTDDINLSKNKFEKFVMVISENSVMPWTQAHIATLLAKVSGLQHKLLIACLNKLPTDSQGSSNSYDIILKNFNLQQLDESDLNEFSIKICQSLAPQWQSNPTPKVSYKFCKKIIPKYKRDNDCSEIYV